MNIIKKHPTLVFSAFLFILFLFFRYKLIQLTNKDLVLIQSWYDFLHDNGFKGLSNGTFSNYPPAYLYMLWSLTLFSNWITPITAIKLIPTVFDLISAFVIFKIASIKYAGDQPFLFAAIFLLLPTVMLNSTGWGQIDSNFTSFLLLCFYLLLKKRPFWAMAAFGMAFSFKAQAVFLLPFLGILFLRKQIRWYNFLVVPGIYILLALPTIFLGRSWESILFLYRGQVGQFENLARYAPNLYFLIPSDYYHPVLEIGLGIFTVTMLVWAWINWKAQSPINQKQIVLTALASVALVPFLLPKMHDRYFYPADVFAFASFVLYPELWFLPLLFQVSSGVTYTIFLFGMQPIFALVGVLINTVLVIFIAYSQIRSLKGSPSSSKGFV